MSSSTKLQKNHLYQYKTFVILSVFSALWRDVPLVIIKGRLYAVLLTLPMKYISYH